MAKIHSPLKIQGAIGDVVISGTKNGGQRAYLKNNFNKRRWLTHPSLARSRGSAIAFGGAAKCASAIYNAIKPGNRDQFLSYAHNRIAKRLRRHAIDGQVFTRRYSFEAAIPALRNLDLSPEGSPTNHVRLNPIGPNHAPTAIRVNGLHEAATTIARDTARLQCRLTRKTIAFPEVMSEGDFDWRFVNSTGQADTWESLWIPLELVPAAGIQVNLPQDQNDQPKLHFVFVEWRQVQPRQTKAGIQKPQDRKPRLLKQQTIIRLAACSMPPAPATQEEPQPKPAARRRYHPTTSKKPKPNRPHLMQTKIYLSLALRDAPPHPKHVPS